MEQPVFILWNGEFPAIWGGHDDADNGPLAFASADDARCYAERFPDATRGYEPEPRTMSEIREMAEAEGWTRLWVVGLDPAGGRSYIGAPLTLDGD